MSGAPATTNPDFTTHFADATSTAFTEGSNDGTLNGTTPVTLVASPGTSTQRIIKAITIQNRDTASVTITVRYVSSGGTRQIARVILAVGDTWTTEGVYDTNGNLRIKIGAVSLASSNDVTGVLPIANGGTGQSTLAGLLNLVYPVGSIYVNANVATNPATLLGFGTWTAFGAGRVMAGFDVAQTEFDVAEETGGAKTHTLTIAEMPAHTHVMQFDHTFGGLASGGVVGRSSATNTNSTGGGGAHNNLQPYIVCYFWKRTA